MSSSGTGTHLRAVAARLLGSDAAADDAMQEAWLRLSRAESEDVLNLEGWLTTVAARLCLDVLRSGPRTHETSTDLPPEPSSPGNDPASEVEVADAVGRALLIVLDRLSPAERLAFVLHDIFAVPFTAIANVLDRSPAATKQLASRARHKVQGPNPSSENSEGSRNESAQREPDGHGCRTVRRGRG